MKCITFLFTLIFAQNIFAQELSFSDVKIRLVPPTSTVSALFMKVENKSNEKISITSIESNLADQVELHNMIMENGSMQMRPVEKIELNAKATTELKRGGLHVMFINLKKPLKEGETHKLKINLSNKKSQMIEAKVQAID